MSVSRKLYNAKILLFGEYGIIKDSMGLSIPYDFYKGALVFSNQDTEQRVSSAKSIEDLCEYLENISLSNEFTCDIDTQRLRQDLSRGLYFDSSIPLGYGVGSSGALVAAIYQRYALNPIDPHKIHTDQILVLKKVLGQMESHFHGTSSGLDPLICYLNLPILIHSKEHINTIGIPESKQDGTGAIFLLDSGMSHSTEHLIEIFFEKMKHEGFRKMLKEEFTALNDACIQAFIDGQSDSLLENVKALSKVVFKHFSPMIPSHLRKEWLKGIRSQAYYLKLCGAGGGGFILGFTGNFARAEQMLKGHTLQTIYRF